MLVKNTFPKEAVLQARCFPSRMVVLFPVAFSLTGLGRSCQLRTLPGTFLAIASALVLQQWLLVRGFQTTSYKPWVAGLAMCTSYISAHCRSLWRPFRSSFHERICLFLGRWSRSTFLLSISVSLDFWRRFTGSLFRGLFPLVCLVLGWVPTVLGVVWGEIRGSLPPLFAGSSSLQAPWRVVQLGSSRLQGCHGYLPVVPELLGPPANL